jgi:acetylornithine deacetylase
MPDGGQLARVLAAVDPDRAVERLRRAIATPSVTGQEGAFADLLADELERAGVGPTERTELEPDREIVLTHWGAGVGRSLLFVGHLDTVRPASWSTRWEDDPRADPHAAVVSDGSVWGVGAADVKSGICAVISALEAIAEAGFRPAGRVATAWVPDEESGEPGMGRSIGMRELADRYQRGELPTPDAAVYVEPTELAVYTAQAGFLIAELTVHGRSAYFGRPERGLDALRGAAASLDSLWRIADGLLEGAPHELLRRPVLVIYTAEAGGPIAVPGSASASVIRTVLPGESLDDAAREIERSIRGAMSDDLDVTVEFPAGRDHPLGGLPFETPLEDILVSTLVAAVGEATGASGRIDGAPFWSELSFLSALGVPGVYFAAGDIGVCHTPDEHVPIDQYLTSIESICRLVATYCGLAETPDRGAHGKA